MPVSFFLPFTALREYQQVVNTCGFDLPHFQFSHPVGGGTCSIKKGLHEKGISIHPPRGGWDYESGRTMGFDKNFNPPTPWGVGLGVR